MENNEKSLNEREEKERELNEVNEQLKEAARKLEMHISESQNPLSGRSFADEELAKMHPIGIADVDVEKILQEIQELAERRKGLKKFFPEFFG